MGEKFSGSTHIVVEINELGEQAAIGTLYNLAAESLCGTDGLRMLTIVRSESNKFAGTFVREYEAPDDVENVGDLASDATESPPKA